MSYEYTNSGHNSQSHNQVAVCVLGNEILEISAGTTCNRQMVQCRINRYKQGLDNPFKQYFENHTTIVHGIITQQPTDLCIQITSHSDFLIPLIVRRNFFVGNGDTVSIGQKCRMRWDFREQATPLMHKMSFDTCDATNLEHITKLVIMLEFRCA